MLTVTVYADEVLLRLDQFPRHLRDALRGKFEDIFDHLRLDLGERMPKKYLDVEQLKTGVDSIGSTLVGFVEYSDKPGKYPISPKAAALLQFRGARDGRWVRTHLVMHPYPKGTSFVENYLLAQKPWVVSQLEEAVRSAPL